MTGHPPHEPEMLRRLVHAAFTGWSVLARYRPAPEWEERRGSLVLHGSARPGPELNYALALGDGDEPPDAVLAAAERFFGASAGYSFIVDVEAAPGVDAALRRRSWALDEEEPALVMWPIPDSGDFPPPPPELEIRRVTTQEELDRFFQVTGAGGRIYLASLEAALDPDVAVLLGLVNGHVVATSRVATTPGPDADAARLAEINGVATVPEARRRGYGTAMTWAAIQAAASRGAAAAVLNASEMGLPVYLRMGFVPAGTFRTYLPPPGD